MISRMGWQKAKTRARYRTIIAIFKPTTWTTDGHIFSTLCHYLSQCDVESDEAHFNEEMQHNASCCCYWCTTLVSNRDVMIVVVVNTLSMIIMITTITNIMIITSHHHPSDASFLSVTYSSSGWQKLAGRRAQKMPSILTSNVKLLIRNKKRSFCANLQTHGNLPCL